MKSNYTLLCEFELKDDCLSRLVHKLDVLFSLCDRNPNYYLHHNLKVSSTSTLSIKIYKNV